MIVEMRTYPVKPGSVPMVEERFEQALPGRLKLSPLAAFWHTEVGELNQVIHVWPYDSLEHREQIRAEAAKVEGWPPNIKEFVLEQQTEIFKPAPFSPPLQPRQLGNLYEVRIYSYQPGSIPMVIEKWAEKIEARAKLSPLVACWYTDSGPVHKWCHIWAYKDAGERERVRQEALKGGNWPAKTNLHGEMLHQRSTFAVPAKFSPLR
jgi:hypothetical protein